MSIALEPWLNQLDASFETKDALRQQYNARLGAGYDPPSLQQMRRWLDYLTALEASQS